MRADVCLIVEGSYPYVTGGVASWTHQLIQGLPDVSFSIVALVPDERFASIDRYQLPANVVSRVNIPLFNPLAGKGRKNFTPAMESALKALHGAPGDERCPHMSQVAAQMKSEGQTAFSLMTSYSSWKLLSDLYQAHGREISFLDYYWTWYALHLPLFRIMEAELPDAGLYHSLSTGYAGFLAALARQTRGIPMLLTEHGLYTREREIEVAQAEWIYTEAAEGSAYAPSQPQIKAWWRRQFQFLGSLAYDAADTLVTLHEPNLRYQLAAGARADKVEIIPNGIDLKRFTPLRAERDWSKRPFHVALIGRVVPIKDVKTFLRAVQIASQAIDLKASVIGPTDEDPAYYEECVQLVETLGLQDCVTFTGSVRVDDWLPHLDLNVLTSISESQPLSLLEGWASGVPSVASDVGACQEMTDGRSGEDALFGPAGLITPVASPDATAQAIVTLARSPERYRAMARAGMARVERFYRQESVFEAYRDLYARLARQA